MKRGTGDHKSGDAQRLIGRLRLCSNNPERCSDARGNGRGNYSLESHRHSKREPPITVRRETHTEAVERDLFPAAQIINHFQ
jgi:hypothetical protein